MALADMICAAGERARGIAGGVMPLHARNGGGSGRYIERVGLMDGCPASMP